MTTPPFDIEDALAQLAERCGIANGYHDIWGNFHATSDQTRRALLTAMHFPAEGDPATLMQQLEDSEWRRTLPPVLVSQCDATPVIALSLPEADANFGWCWTLTTEAGSRSSGEFVPSHLNRLGERILGDAPFVRVELVLPELTEPGYHSLEIWKSDAETGSSSRPLAVMTLIVAPVVCFQPEAVSGSNRTWGLTVQLYGLRSRRNWGIGDFSDLHSLVDMTAEAGGGVLGVNPLHALFPENPGRISPYSPSNRCYLNILYLDVAAVPEFAECEAARQLVGNETFQARLRRLRTGSQVAYEEASAVKREVLALLYRHFFDKHLSQDDDRAQAFKRYRKQCGASLEQHARFEALQDHFHHENPTVWGWPAWPEAYRHPEAPAVSVFAEEYREAVTFFVWLQWLADEQLVAVGQHAARRGLGVGLYQDLALGVNPGGSEYWTNQEVFAKDAYAGAPPDDFNLYGQDWGLPPLVPHRLRDAAYAPFIAVLRAAMRQGGALRIDHVIGLARVFWVPAGRPATEGSYVACPLEDLLGIVALESQRNQCLVIGEDLGTVPDGFQTRLNAAGILSYRPFLFERTDGGNFKPPSEYPRQALVAVSTHDLPTLSGLWQGHDLDLRSALKLFPSEELRRRQLVERSQDRARILMALEGAGLLPDEASVHPVSMPVMTPAVMIAIHAYLARSPAQVLVVQPEDIFGQIEQANLPGSQDDQHPNWRRRLPLNLEDWRGDERFTALKDALRRERGNTLLRHGEVAQTRRTAVIPRATYRFQFNRDFTFAQATELVPYLAELGISHCYASPYLKAR
ncbi:MAG: 4-alpha-glucanotransferase, partial [Propionivibrio sp.]|nr:4-alpha-glucanotransferase [Candidatus Propionivibrio dominans]